MRRNILEIVMGLIVIVGAIAFTGLVYRAADINNSAGYEIGAEFGTTGGLVVGDDVRLSGIKIGQITGQSLDPVTYVARIDMRIQEHVHLPADSAARITQASLLGGNFLEIIPGAAEDMLAQGEVIYDTHDPVSLSDLLGRIVFQSSAEN